MKAFCLLRSLMLNPLRFYLLLLLGGVFLGSATAYAQTRLPPGERRVALVVGNSNYKTSPLKNPANDARAMSAALRRLGFEVIERQNLNREAFSLAARDFGDKLKGATVGLFYFAGHGLQVRGRNFLVPVDADIAREDEVPYRSLDVNEVLDKMDAARTPINLVLLDACRNNPFARSFKLSQVGLAQMDAPAGTLIAFATSPGSVAQDGDGDNGLYTSALLKHINAPEVPIEQMLKRVRVDVARSSNNGQVPWESSSLNRDFAFASSSLGLQAAPASAASQGNAATELALELAFWEAVKGSSNTADYRAYLEQYPQGRFAALARLRSSAVSGAGQAPAFVNGNVISTGTKLTTAAPVMAPGQVRAESPEGWYSAVVSAGQVVLIDRRNTSTLKTYALDGTGNLTVGRSNFSPDGRWLLVGGMREAKAVQMLMEVSSGRIVWERAGSAAVFEASQPLVRLQLDDGRFESIELRQGS